MALALNSSHPLFGNIAAFVCPNEANNAIVDLKVPSRVITETNGTFTYGTGTYGRSMNAPDVNGTYLALSPTLFSGDRRNATYTIMAIANNTATLFGGGTNQPQYFAYGSNAESMTIDKTGGFLAYSQTPGQNPTVITDADVLAAGAYSAAYTYAGTDAGNLINIYHNGVFKSSGTPDSTSSTRAIDALHSKQGFTRHTTNYAYIIVFNRVLTGTEISDLHASLGANNQFALLESAPAVTPISFTGNIANQTFTAGDVVNVDLATGNYAGTETPFTYANAGTALTGTGLSISSAGVLTGTATTQATVTGVIMRGTDTATNTADSNAFSVTVNPAPTTHNVTLADALPSTTSSITSTFEPIGIITIADFANNTATPLPSLTGLTVNVRSLVDGTTVYRTTTATTDGGADLTVTDPSIVTGTKYEVTVLKDNAGVWDIGIIIATAT